MPDDSWEEKLGRVEMAVTHLLRDMGRLEAKIDALNGKMEARISRLETRVSAHDSRLSFIYGIGAVLALIWSGILAWIGMRK